MNEYTLNLRGGGLASQAQSYYGENWQPLSGVTTDSYVPDNSRIKTLAEIQQQQQGTKTPTATTTPSWLANAQVLGTLGLGLASFLENKKTAGLQRDALRQNLALSKEHQANRQALGQSWNKAWSQ